MVYRRYITRSGKKFGPYYYESYRDEKGISRTRKVDPPKKAFKLFYFFMICSLFLMVAFVTLNIDLEGPSDEGKEIIERVVQSFFVGFNVLEEEIVSVENNIIEEIISGITQPSEEIIDEPVPEEETVDGPPIIEETTPEIIGEEQITQEINQTQESTPPIVDEPIQNNTLQSPRDPPAGGNITEIINETIIEQNITEENITIVNETTQNITINDENITEINQTQGNITLINKTTEKITIENKTMQGVNFTTEISTIHYGAVLGKPVKWKKTLKLEVSGNNKINDLTVDLPSLAGNISIKKIDANTGIEEELEVNVKNEKIIGQVEPIISLTGQVIKSEKQNIFKKILKFFRGIFSVIGRIVEIGETQEEVLVNIQEELEDQDEIEIEYYTDAPYAEEIVFNDNYKKITIVGPEEVHYENVLAFSELSIEVNLDKINLYWIKDGSRVLTNFDAYDLNENGLYDYIEWVVPSLSNQTYEIILITKAEHLDENRTFIEDVYDLVKEEDGNYTNEIPTDNYVRVTFEKNLTSDNDITVYAKSSPGDDSGEPNSTSSIEVYEKNGIGVIAVIENIASEDYYKTYLDSLIGSQDVFDLKVIGNPIQFDFIIDPPICPEAMTGDGSLTDPCVITNWTQLQAMNQSLKNNYTLKYDIDSSIAGYSDYQSGSGFSPVGNFLGTFNGTFNGGNYNITGLFINRTGLDDIGLFGRTFSSSQIKDVGLVDINITGRRNVGGLVGYMDGGGSVSNSYAIGSVRGTSIVIGGLVGRSEGDISNSSFTGSVNGTINIGGLVGHNGGNVSNSYSVSNVTGQDSVGALIGFSIGPVSNSYSTGFVNSSGNVGGLIGALTSSSINNSYSTANVVGSGDVGGLVGNAGAASIISYSYSTGFVNGTGNVGGLLGLFSGLGQCLNNFWDNEISGQSTNVCSGVGIAEGKTTLEMVNQSTFDPPWDFNNVWKIVAGSNSYPCLQWQDNSSCIFPDFAVPNITNCEELQNMNLDLSGDYQLMNNIDCSDTVNWNSGSGFNPVGINTGPFTGTFNGSNYNITSLFISRSSTSYVGLFGYAGSSSILRDVGLIDVNITGTEYTGGLVGWSGGNVSNSYSSGNVNGSANIGGLVGLKAGGAVFNSSSSSYVIGIGNNVGGLIGSTSSGANVSNSYATGNTNGTIYVGGLVGYVLSSISNSYATGNATGTTGVGGLIGYIPNSGDSNYVNNSYSIGNVIGTNYAGGFIGGSYKQIENSYSTGSVSGGAGYTGGFAGVIVSTSVSNSYSIGNVSSTGSLGGFIGQDGGGTYFADFWDYETTGNYNDSGTSPFDLVDISANTTSVMTAQSTFVNAGWDFNNTWKINSYPCLQWQDDSTCISPPSTPQIIPTPTGGRPTIEDFVINKNLITIILIQGEQKSENFTVTNTGETSLILSIDMLGNIEDFVVLSDNSVFLGLGESATIDLNFSAEENATLGAYIGQIEISGPLTKVIDIALNIVEPFPIEEEEPALREEEEVPEAREAGAAEKVKDILEKSSKLFTGIAVIVLWFPLLLLLLFYFIIRKYIKLRNQISGYESREEKIAAINRFKKASRKANFFERLVDRGAIYLVAKMEVGDLEGEKVSRLAVMIKSKEAYNLGTALYHKKDYNNALKEFKKSVKIDNKFWQGYQGIGNCYATKGMLKETIAAYEKSVSINPDNAKLTQWLKRYKR